MYSTFQAQVELSNFPSVLNSPTSPEAAWDNEHSNVGVGPYSGSTSVGIPLYTLEEDGFSLPLSLSYQSTGIKLEDMATWVGLGWNLSVDGTIRQEAQGIRDSFDNTKFSTTNGYEALYNRIESSGGYGSIKIEPQKGDAEPFMWNPAIGGDVAKCCNNSSQSCFYTLPVGSDNPHTLFNLNAGEGAPDIYHFSFAGHQGKFYIDPNTSKIIAINQSENIRFEVIPDTKITAYLPNGIEFHFAAVEILYLDGYIKFNEFTGRNYKLTEIKLKNGQSIYFEYENLEIQNSHISELDPLQVMNYHTQNNVGSPPYPPSVTVGPDPTRNQQLKTMLRSEVKQLSKIHTRFETLVFTLESREDILALTAGNIKRLKSIEVLRATDQRKIKAFDFQYSYFDYSAKGVNSDLNLLESYGKRLKLLSLQESYFDNQGTKIPLGLPYRFEYDESQIMPARNSLSKDIWGYYNGSNGNGTLIPDLEYFDYPRIFKSLTFNQTYFTYAPKLNNRYASEPHAKLYSLRKMHYPTGGFSTFEYELQSFTNVFVPDQTQNAKALKSIQLNNQGRNNSTNQITQVSFPASRTLTIEFAHEIFDGYTGLQNPNQPTYSYEELKSFTIEFSRQTLNSEGQVISTQILKSWNLSSISMPIFSSTHKAIWQEKLEVPLMSNVSYQLKIVGPSSMYKQIDTYRIAGVKASAKFYDDTGVDTSQGKGGGIRVKQIDHYDRTNAIVEREQFSYEGGKLLNGFSPIEAKRYFLFGCGGRCPHEYISDWYNLLSINSETLDKSNAFAVGYNSVKKEKKDLSGKAMPSLITEYNYLNFQNQSSSGFSVIEDPRNGLLQKEILWEGLSRLAQKTYTYQNLRPLNNVFYSLQLVRNLYTDGYSPCLGMSSGADSKTIYSYFATPLISNYYRLTSVKNEDYTTEGTLTQTENFHYNNQHILSSLERSDLQGKKSKINYFYAQDLANLGLLAANMSEVPLIIERMEDHGQGLVTQSKIEYKYEGPTFKPTKKLLWNVNNPTSYKLEISYDKYDLSTSNLLQYTGPDQIPTVQLWGYGNRYLIASIKGATYPDPTSPKSTDIPQNLISGLSESTASLTSFREALKSRDFLISTFQHAPLFGLSSITEPSGTSSTFTYHASGYLESKKDIDAHIVEEYSMDKMKLGGVSYDNTSQSGIFTRDTCQDTEIGNAYTYIVPPGKYRSYLSIAEANQLAQEDVLREGQIAANNFGTCSTAPISTCSFTKNPAISSSTFTVVFSNFKMQGKLGQIALVFSTQTSYAWGNFQFVGTVATPCAPGMARTIEHIENGRKWSSQINPDGKIYLKLISGPTFTSSQVINLQLQYLK